MKYELDSTQFSSKAEYEKYLYGRNIYIVDLKKWQSYFNEEQIKLEGEFKNKNLDEININIWDDFKTGETTYLYVDNSKIPNKLILEFLLHILSYIKSDIIIKNTGVIFDLQYFNSSLKYPELIGEYSSLCYQRWEIILSNVTNEKIEIIIGYLNRSLPSFNNVKFNFYSES